MKRTFIKYLNKLKILNNGQKSALLVVTIFILVGLFSPFISNNKPIICKYQDEIYLPVLKDKKLRRSILQENKFVDFKKISFDWSIWPLIKYLPGDIDEDNASCVGPFAKQIVSSFWHRHYLGTDELGRDIAAGIVHGARIALFVGFGASLLSLFIGFILGITGGYFGDHHIRWPVSKIIFGLVSIFLVSFWIFGSSRVLIPHPILKWFIWLFALVSLWSILTWYYRSIKSNSRQIAIPFDFVIQRGIEVFQSIPGFFVMLIALMLVSSPSIINVILIIGILRWPRIAQFVRAECLRIKQHTYIKNAQLSGHSSFSIIRHHIIRGVLTSIVVHVSFGIGSAILIESAISFLGLGLGTEHLTWGAILSESRKYFYAWWLAIFPGVSIFAVVYSFNVLGEMLLDKINPMRELG